MSQYRPPCCLSAMCSSNWAREACHGGLWKQAPVSEGTSHYSHTWAAALPQGGTRRDGRTGGKVRKTQEHKAWICSVWIASNGPKLLSGPPNCSVSTNPSTKFLLVLIPIRSIKMPLNCKTSGLGKGAAVLWRRGSGPSESPRSVFIPWSHSRWLKENSRRESRSIHDGWSVKKRANIAMWC